MAQFITGDEGRRKVRILRISHSAVVDQWRERERALRRLGHDVHLLSSLSWNEAGAEVPLTPRPGEDVEGVRTWGQHPALFVYAPRQLWHELGKEWDLVDLHEEPFALATAEVLAIKWLRRNRAPYALYSAQNLEKNYPPPFRWFERAALRGAAAVHTCNDAAARIVEGKGFPGQAVNIPLGTDLQTFTPQSDPTTARAPGVDARTITVGYAGRLATHKGVDVLLEAVAGDSRLHLRVAGAGPAEAALRARASQLDLAGRVTFLGVVRSDELPDFYRSCDVLAVPSRTTPGWIEQFGRVAVESMACGTPVVASATGALPDVVGDAGLLVPEGDPEALRSALIRVVTEPGLRDRLRDAGLATAARTGWDEVARRYSEMYATATHLPNPETRRALHVIVVAYGAPDLLERALTPVRDLPVTVIDNSSRADIREICALLGVTYVDPGRNGGFAAGVNEGLRRLDDPTADVLLLNPDAVVTPEQVTELHRALLADPELASVAPAQVDDTGAPAKVQWPFPHPLGTWTEAVGLGKHRSAANGFVIGSVLLLRAEALAQVGPFDERFFLYAEETDWAYRAHLLGWRNAVVSTVTAMHIGAATSTDPWRRESWFHASQERYMRKHFGALGWQIARLGEVAGSAVRGAVLRGERQALARHRFTLYRTGPIRAEQPRPGYVS